MVARLSIVMDPQTRSRFTGFRVARSIGKRETAVRSSDEFFRKYKDAPKGFGSSLGALTPLATSGTSLDDWNRKAADIKARWAALLAEPKSAGAKPASRLIHEVTQQEFQGTDFPT